MMLENVLSAILVLTPIGNMLRQACCFLLFMINFLVVSSETTFMALGSVGKGSIQTLSPYGTHGKFYCQMSDFAWVSFNTL